MPDPHDPAAEAALALVEALDTWKREDHGNFMDTMLERAVPNYVVHALTAALSARAPATPTLREAISEIILRTGHGHMIDDANRELMLDKIAAHIAAQRAAGVDDKRILEGML